MEIFQWLFKLGKAPERSEPCSINCTDHEPTTTLTNRRTRKSSTRGSKHGEQRKNRGIWLWCRKDVAEACFYRTLTLKRLRSSRKEHFLRSMAKIKARGGGEEEEVISTRFDPKKTIKVVEPEKHDESSKEKAKSEQSKAKATLLRMKELIRWAAAAKSDKAVKFFTPKIIELRNRRKLKMMREVNEESKRMSSESANISVRWESCESCTTLSSSDHISIVSSPAIFVSLGPTAPLYRCRSRKGNWITTDSEFVVLEL